MPLDPKNPEEEIMKRLQGIKDSRGPVGMFARGKNMYPGGNAAQEGPGGPDMGRPTVNPQAVQAVLQNTGKTLAPPGLQKAPGTPAQPVKKTPSTSLISKTRPNIQAAAKRRIQRG